MRGGDAALPELVWDFLFVYCRTQQVAGCFSLLLQQIVGVFEPLVWHWVTFHGIAAVGDHGSSLTEILLAACVFLWVWGLSYHPFHLTSFHLNEACRESTQFAVAAAYQNDVGRTGSFHSALSTEDMRSDVDARIGSSLLHYYDAGLALIC